MSSVPSVTEADILERVVAPVQQGLTPEVARSLLALRFDRAATKDIRQLLAKNNRGTITTGERDTLEKYLRVGQLLDLLHAQARLALRQAGNSR